MKKPFFKSVLFCLISAACLGAEWLPISKNLSPQNVLSLAVDPLDAAVVFAGSDRQVFKTVDGGGSWEKVLSLKGASNQVRAIYTDPYETNTVYVATDHGVLRSRENGKRWKPILKDIGGRRQSVYCLANRRDEPGVLWLGTSNRLYQWNSRGNGLTRVPGWPAIAVYSIYLSDAPQPLAILATEKGIYKKEGASPSWERVHVETPGESAANPEETGLQQFNIEELTGGPHFSNIIYIEQARQFYAATPRGILEAPENASHWKAMDGQTLPNPKINFIARSSQTFYVGTPQGLFQWDAKSKIFRELEGLSAVNTVAYHAAGDYLLVGTEKGVFKLLHPELNLMLPGGEYRPVLSENILAQFKHEPDIRQVQQAAVLYAEVHPDKIRAWRQAAARKALFPDLSLNADMSHDQNVDLDRGGTGDPDKFILGPEEKSRDWSVGVSWDLGDLVWNGDQTSIDVRSRLMVELRQDILNEVTHLYFERRRLQIEMSLAPPRELPLELEKKVRLEELTAEIDALTDGFLTQHLSNAQ